MEINSKLINKMKDRMKGICGLDRYATNTYVTYGDKTKFTYLANKADTRASVEFSRVMENYILIDDIININQNVESLELQYKKQSSTYTNSLCKQLNRLVYFALKSRQSKYVSTWMTVQTKIDNKLIKEQNTSFLLYEYMYINNLNNFMHVKDYSIDQDLAEFYKMTYAMLRYNNPVLRDIKLYSGLLDYAIDNHLFRHEAESIGVLKTLSLYFSNIKYDNDKSEDLLFDIAREWFYNELFRDTYTQEEYHKILSDLNMLYTTIQDRFINEHLSYFVLGR